MIDRQVLAREHSSMHLYTSDTDLVLIGMLLNPVLSNSTLLLYTVLAAVSDVAVKMTAIMSHRMFE